MPISLLDNLEKFAAASNLPASRAYLANPVLANYDAMRTELRALVVAQNLLAGVTGAPFTSTARILVTVADGTTHYDSGKTDGTTAEDGNTVVDSKNKFRSSFGDAIGVNHNSRSAIAQAAFGTSGIGLEQKLSTTTGKNEQYLAHRMGKSNMEILGVVRFSLVAV